MQLTMMNNKWWTLNYKFAKVVYNRYEWPSIHTGCLWKAAISVKATGHGNKPLGIVSAVLQYTPPPSDSFSFTSTYSPTSKALLAVAVDWLKEWFNFCERHVGTNQHCKKWTLLNIKVYLYPAGAVSTLSHFTYFRLIVAFFCTCVANHTIAQSAWI